MATLTLRNVKGSPLTNAEVDANFSNLNSDKVETSAISAFGGTLIDDADASAARTTLGLGTAATSASSDFLAVASNLSDLNSASTARTNLGLGTAATSDSTDFDPAGTAVALAIALG